MTDILLKKEGWTWSYRVAAIIENEGKVLLVDHIERSTHEFAFPGGHVQFGEEAKDALIREIKEELGLDIEVLNLRWVEENFWKWHETPTHQIALYFDANILNYKGNQDTLQGFEIYDNKKTALVFRWVDKKTLATLNVYPRYAAEELTKNSKTIKHFISRALD